MGRKKKKWGREEVKVKGKREKFPNSQTGQNFFPV